MKLAVLDWSKATQQKRAETLARPVARKSDELSAAVAAILADVRQRGDRALLDLTQRYDRVKLESLRVTSDEIRAAYAKVSRQALDDLNEAIRRVSAFHQAQLPGAITVETSPGVRCERRYVPVDRVGLYIPGGTAPLPSTVVMLGAPSKIAGNPKRVLITPPRVDGSIDAYILVTADLLGITEIFKAGGAQAIGALAYGTQSVPKVDKIFGPGNSWVTEAKLQVARDPRGAACDMPAGPSEVMVVADDGADPAAVASDLLSQAEHGEDSQVVLLSDSLSLIEKVQAETQRQLETLPRKAIAEGALSHSALILTSLSDALLICNEYAPEHLILQVKDARAFADRVRNAGSIFLGAWTPESAGDYASGTNHVLPTYGFARAFGGLTTESFMKSMTLQEITRAGLKELGPVVERLALMEGLDAHARAVSLRLAKHQAGAKS